MRHQSPLKSTTTLKPAKAVMDSLGRYLLVREQDRSRNRHRGRDGNVQGGGGQASRP